MEWTKIPTDLLQSRLSDKEILAITKYQMLWAMLERQPTDSVCLRYMTSKQLQQAREYMSAIERRVNADIKSVESNRKRQKLFYEKNQTLIEKPNGYTNDESNALSTHRLTTQIRLDKIREDNIPPVSKDTVPQRVARFQKPTIDEIRVYCSERNNGIIAESFYDFYESKGWKIGSSPMKDWKAAVRNWERKRTKPQKTTQAEEVFNHNFAHLQSLFEGEENAQ